MTQRDADLVDAATQMLLLRKSRISKTACALRTSDGTIFASVNVRIPDSAPCSVCAEQLAIGMAVAAGHSEFECVVAVGCWKTGEPEVISPCGMCREFMRAFGDPYVIVNGKAGLVKKKLHSLPWQL